MGSYQNTITTYDELNSMAHVKDLAVDVQYEYDAVGNRRAVHATYFDPLTAGFRQRDDMWYTYDAADRFTMTKGNDVAIIRNLHYTNTATGLVMRRDETMGGKTFQHFYYYAEGKRIGDVSTDPNDNYRKSYAEELAMDLKNQPSNADRFKNFHPRHQRRLRPELRAHQRQLSGCHGDQLHGAGGRHPGQHRAKPVGRRRHVVPAGRCERAEGQRRAHRRPRADRAQQGHEHPQQREHVPAVRRGGDDRECGPDATRGAAATWQGRVRGNWGDHHGGGGVIATIYTAGAFAAAGAFGSSAAASAAAAGGIAAGAGAGAIGATLAAGTAVLGGAAGFAAAVAAGVVGAAVGSAARQLAGMATGNVSSFSWRQVGQSAFAGGVTAGVGSALSLSPASVTGSGGWSTGESALRGTALAAASTGVNMAMRGDWSWRQMAAAAVGAGAGAAAGAAIGSAMNAAGIVQGAQFSQRLAAGMAGGWASSEVTAGHNGFTQADSSVLFASAFGSAVGPSFGDTAIGNMSTPDDDQMQASQEGFRAAEIREQNAQAQSETLYGFGMRSDGLGVNPFRGGNGLALPSSLRSDFGQRVDAGIYGGVWDAGQDDPQQRFADALGLAYGDGDLVSTGGGSARSLRSNAGRPIQLRMNERANGFFDSLSNLAEDLTSASLLGNPVDQYRGDGDALTRMANEKEIDRVRTRFGQNGRNAPEIGQAWDASGRAVPDLSGSNVERFRSYDRLLNTINAGGAIEVDSRYNIVSMDKSKLTTDAFAAAFSSRYQATFVEGYKSAVELNQQGLLKINDKVDLNNSLGQYADDYARARMRTWVDRENVPDLRNGIVSINRRPYGDDMSASFRIPDTKLDFGPNQRLILDGTVGIKGNYTPQISDFRLGLPNTHVIVVRPYSLGGPEILGRIGRR